MIWPILIVVTSNTVYNICAKSTPETVNGFAPLAITYTIAAACAVLLFYLTAEEKQLLAELGKTNWTAWVLGLSIVGLEFGFLCVYRMGWNISMGNLTASITLSCVLLLAGVLLYRETLTLRQILGMAVCVLGLVLITE
ncbi:EamA family transporter [Oscillospiraceae bacterium 38-13]